MSASISNYRKYKVLSQEDERWLALSKHSEMAIILTVDPVIAGSSPVVLAKAKRRHDFRRYEGEG